MVQIWLTDSEISSLFELPLGAARDQATSANWPRRLSTDGHTRYKISDGAAHLFMVRYARQFFEGEGAEAIVEDAKNQLARGDPIPDEEEALPESSGAGDAAVSQPAPEAAGGGPIEIPFANGAGGPSALTAEAKREASPQKLSDADYWEGIFRRAFENSSPRR